MDLAPEPDDNAEEIFMAFPVPARALSDSACRHQESVQRWITCCSCCELAAQLGLRAVTVLTHRPVLPVSLCATGPADRSSACRFAHPGAQQGFQLRHSPEMSLSQAGHRRQSEMAQQRQSLGPLIRRDNRVNLG